MRGDNFIFKTHISFGIKSDIVEPDIITKELGIVPADSSFKKGDTYIGKNTNRTYTRDTNIWRLETEWTYHEEETVSQHIEFLKKILLPKTDILIKYKEDERFDVSFWIWIDSECAGIGLYLTEDELKFLHSISNWVHFSLICKTKITENE